MQDGMQIAMSGAQEICSWAKYHVAENFLKRRLSELAPNSLKKLGRDAKHEYPVLAFSCGLHRDSILDDDHVSVLTFFVWQ